MEVFHQLTSHCLHVIKAKNQIISFLLLQITICICYQINGLLCGPLGDKNINTVQKFSNATVLSSPTNSTTRKPRLEIPKKSDQSDTITIIDKKVVSRKVKNEAYKVDVSHLFREEIDGYPEDEIKLILEKTPTSLKELFNVLNTALDPNFNLSERIADHAEDDSSEYGTREESICRTVTRNIYPREANKNNAQVYIPNNQEFMQVIQAELCQKPDQECSYLQDNLPYGMQSACYQKYAYKKLLYLDPLEKRMASDIFRYPSCCSCYVKTLSVELRSSDHNSTSIKFSNQLQVNSSHESSSNSSSTNGSGSHLKKKSFDLRDDQSKHVKLPLVGSNITNAHQASNSSLSPNARTPKQAKLTAVTVVLQEDKVYTPNSQDRK